MNKYRARIRLEYRKLVYRATPFLINKWAQAALISIFVIGIFLEGFAAMGTFVVLISSLAKINCVWNQPTVFALYLKHGFFFMLFATVGVHFITAVVQAYFMVKFIRWAAKRD